MVNHNNTFAKYIENALANKIYDGTPEGDFVEDASLSNEQTVMDHIDSWNHLQYYLESQNACEGAIEAARSVWNDYLNTK